MGLKVTAKEGEKFNFLDLTGEEKQVNEIYVRLEFYCFPCGKKINGSLKTYYSKEAFKNGANEIKTGISGANFEGEIQGNDKQSVETAEKIAQTALIESGYTTEIV